MSPDATGNAKTGKLRQHALAVVLGAILLYFGGQWAVDHLLEAPIEAAHKRTADLKEAIRKREEALARARQWSQVLATWENQSLPTDTEVARSLYQAWLLELVDDVRLENPAVNSNEPVSRRGIYYTLSFTVRARGNLQQLTQFLFAFYRTDLLHQIRSLNILPLSGSDRLDLSMSIEALVLPRAGKAPAGQTTPEKAFEQFRARVWRVSNQLASPALADYDPIVTRNLFGMGGSPDPTDYAYLTSINMVDGEPQVWFTLRATDEVLKLKRGDAFQIGPVAGTLVDVAGSDVVIESDGERWLLSLGEKLTDAFALPPELW